MPFRQPYKILVTGGAGFIASHLVDELIARGEEVHVIDNLSTGKQANLNPKAHWHFLDLVNDMPAIQMLCKEEQFNYIFHLAAMARIQDCQDQPAKSYGVNTAGTLFLLEAARKYRPFGFVFSSSSSVYGEVSEEVPIHEETDKNPISMYGLQKLQAEQLVLRYAKDYGINASALRYFNVYGTKRQSADGAYPNVFASFNKDKDKRIRIYGDGEQRRDYIHVFDVVRANTRFLETQKAWGDVFNIGTGETHTVNEIARYFNPKETSYEPARASDPRYSCANVRKAEKVLGFKAAYSFEEGVRIFLNDKEKGNV